MTLPSLGIPPLLRIYQTLNQYPILRNRIRKLMRDELFSRGIIRREDFIDQVRQEAISSQFREGVKDPFGEEPEELWRTRLERIENKLIDIHFADNLSFEVFEELVKDVLVDQGVDQDQWIENFNAQLAPQAIVFEQALQISRMSTKKQEEYRTRIEELKVVMIRNMISDQLSYIKIAKKWFTLKDLLDIQSKKIGRGKIGGKSAGMLLSHRIIQDSVSDKLKAHVKIPESYFLAADVMYAFMATNDLLQYNKQKYKTADEIRAEYPNVVEIYLAGRFPQDVEDNLRNLLLKLDGRPFIVRSSSLLEDNFGTSFAGKYESHFVPNQGTSKQNMYDFTQAIIKVYASILSPDPLLYRKSMDLLDYDERIALLIQVVEGEKYGDYFLPHGAGVGFSRNMYRWSPEIEREAGFLRMVWGMGTRAVDRVGNDYPRMVALSHPQLHTHSDVRAIIGYTQKQVDLIDLKENIFKTMMIKDVLGSDYENLRYIAQIHKQGYLSQIRSNIIGDDQEIVVNFDTLFQQSDIAGDMKEILQTLEREYKAPVDMEFAIRIDGQKPGEPEVDVIILQCRPLSHAQEIKVAIPKDIKDEDVIFKSSRVLVPGIVEDIDYVLFVPQENYFGLETQMKKAELGRVISRVNHLLEDENFILVGPGRWGTVNPDLGVRVGYADIFHSKALIEVTGLGIGGAPEPSFGTHFFQDLIEAKIFPLAIFLDDEDVEFNREFFYDTPNNLGECSPDEERFSESVRLIRVDDFRSGYKLELVMDDEQGLGVAYLKQTSKLQED
jgi:hypothetical protein